VTAGPHPDLADPAGWAAASGALLADLGFSLVNGDDPSAPGRANLLVALRSVPTRRHFDPEMVSCWRFEHERSHLVTIDRSSAIDGERRFSWGRIRTVDRLHVENVFLAFGGIVRVADLAADLRVVQFHAPAPILRWAGHSQGVDALTDEVGAFFARLMIPIDFRPGAEVLVGQADPDVLYAAFVQDAWRRFAATQNERDAEPELAIWARREVDRFVG
jgi:hypothetical protein